MEIFLKKLDVVTINQKIIIPDVAPSQVFDAYVDPKKHSEFTDSKASGKPVVGGKFSAWDGYIFGKFLSLEVGKRVVQEWTTTDWEEGYPASELELTNLTFRRLKPMRLKKAGLNFIGIPLRNTLRRLDFFDVWS
jgi:activator of HSP90 ATPase